LYPYCPQFNPEPIFKICRVRLEDVNLRTAGRFKILSMRGERGGLKTKLKMQMFTDTIGTEISGALADIYVTLPQSLDTPYEPTANIVDLIILKKDLNSENYTL
jgi:hypothetical protein